MPSTNRRPLDEALDEALGDYESALDELGEACDATSVEEVEQAVTLMDSTLDRLLEWDVAIRGSPTSICGEPDSALRAIQTNKKLTEAAVTDVKTIMKETPSNGEQLEEQLEKMIELASVLYEAIEGIRL